MIKRSDMVIKIGLVRCGMASRSCPGTSCFKVIKTGTGTLEEFKGEEIDIIGMVTCGGFPGRESIRQVREMIRRGAELISLCTCFIKKQFPIRLSDFMLNNLQKRSGRCVMSGSSWESTDVFLRSLKILGEIA